MNYSLTGGGRRYAPKVPRVAYGRPGHTTPASSGQQPVYSGPGFSSFGQQQPPPPANPYDFSGDPALQTILAQDAAARADAQAAATAAEKRLAIQLGDATGIIKDGNTAKEAAANPYSTLASLLKAYGQQKTNTNETANKANLYYSGARAKALQDDAYGYQHQVYDARQSALNALAGIQQNLANSLSGANQSDANGYSQAYQNATSQATSYGYNPGATNTGSTSRIAQQLSSVPKIGFTNPAFRTLMGNRNLRMPTP